MSKLLVTVDHQFQRTPDGKVYVKTIYGYDFWKRYLKVFDTVRIVGRIKEVTEITEKMLISSGDNVEFFALPHYHGPFEFVKKKAEISKAMLGACDGCDAALFRIPSPIAPGVMKQAKKAGIPWAVEVVNDPWDTFAPGSYKSITRPAVRIFFTNQVKSMAKSANGASYVTKFALQKRYPAYARIHGEDEKHFESYYSSIMLREEYFVSEHKLPESGYNIVHINSAVIDYSKGHDVVIRALKIMRDKGVDARITFVGDGPMRTFFEQYAAEQGVGEYVTFTGLLSSQQEVREQLINADIMIFPTKGEGLPRTLIEAMAVGLPCLSTPVNGIPELLNETEMLGQQDSEGFAKKAISILTDKSVYKKLSDENIEKAKQYVDDILDKRRVEFYSKLKNITLK